MFLLFTINVFSQEEKVLTVGYQNHQITTNDTIDYSVTEEFYWWSNKNRVDFESDLSRLNRVETVSMPRDTMYRYENKIIYINSYLNDYPNFKRVVLFHAILAEIYGIPKEKGNSLDVMNAHFYVTPKFENAYKYRRTHKKDIKEAMLIFETHKPLNTLN